MDSSSKSAEAPIIDLFLSDGKASPEQVEAIKASGLFVASWYRQNYLGPTATDDECLAHFVERGLSEGYDPGPMFNARYYLSVSPDIRKHGFCPLLHFIAFGQYEQRLSNQKAEWKHHLALTRDFLRLFIERHGFDIGEYTYGTPRVIGDFFGTLSIGRFCSIGPDVELVLANHRKDFVSTYPFNWLSARWPTAEGQASDHIAPRGMTIGNDVWIGAKAIILPGVTIGDGAIIGAASLVRADVPPYAIVAGNPAKIVSYRFEQSIIDRLLTLAWWDWPEERIAAMLPVMLSDDIERFIELATNGDA